MGICYRPYTISWTEAPAFYSVHTVYSTLSDYWTMYWMNIVFNQCFQLKETKVPLGAKNNRTGSKVSPNGRRGLQAETLTGSSNSHPSKNWPRFESAYLRLSNENRCIQCEMTVWWWMTKQISSYLSMKLYLFYKILVCLCPGSTDICPERHHNVRFVPVSLPTISLGNALHRVALGHCIGWTNRKE